MFRHIREALAYAQADAGHKFVLKIGLRIFPDAERLGIIQNIGLLRAAGIKLVVTHACLRFKPDDWPSLKTWAVKVGRDNLDGIQECLRGQRQQIPVVYCGQGQESQSDRAAASLAVELKADKLVYLTDHDLRDGGDQIIHQMVVERAREMLLLPEMEQDRLRDKLKSAVWAFEQGVARVHIINAEQEDALLGELLTSEGVGTMIYRAGKDYMKPPRWAKAGERAEIGDIIRSAEFPEPVDLVQALRNPQRFRVRLYDDTVHGCVQVTVHKACPAMELAYLATSRIYEDGPDAEELLADAISLARKQGLTHMFMETARTQIWLGIYPWFLKHGFRRRPLGEVLPGALLGRDANTEVWYTQLA